MLQQTIGRHPFAVILMYFNDTAKPTTPTVSDFSDFVSASVQNNLNDFYKQISNNRIDITGSQVFGWWEMPYAYSDLFGPSGYAAAGPKNYSRHTWIAEAKSLFAKNKPGASLDAFSGVIAVVNGVVDDSNDGGPNLAMGFMGDWGQKNWRLCVNCGCLFSAGGSAMGHCAASATRGPHVFKDANYHLAWNMPKFPVPGVWRQCENCLQLIVDGVGEKSPCPASPGATHVVSAASGQYSLTSLPASPKWIPWQTDWKQCSKCNSLAYTKVAGVCAKDGKAHDFSNSDDYILVYDTSHYNLSFTCHEVGHCFGFMHSHGKDDTPAEAYGDPLDMMGGGPQFQPARWHPAGPGMSGASLFREGWMASDRVWTAPLGAQQSFQVTLAPVNHPEYTGSLLARVLLGERVFTVEFRNGTGWDQGLKTPSVYVHDMQTVFTAGQNGWRNCSKCNGLHYMGAAPCPVGGVHDPAQSAAYVVPYASATATGQAGWKWCKKCQNLVIGAGKCTAGGQHDTSGSSSYQLPYAAAATTPQYAWRACRVCQALCNDKGPVAGSCPGGGWHDFSNSSYYLLQVATPAPPGSQAGWRACDKCQSLFYHGASPCPAGDYHAVTGSSDYSLVSEGPIFDSIGQKGWRWCWKCQGLGYAGSGSNGACPAGGAHDYSASGSYLIQYASSKEGQDGWRMCSQCFGMVYGNLPTAGPCPAQPGSQHAFGTDDFLLAYHGLDATYYPDGGTLTKGKKFTDTGTGLTVLVDDIDPGGTYAKVTITTK
jgi:hypothetical protein